MEDYLIVDGYNIINDWPEFAGVKDEDYAHARDTLIEILADLKGLTDLNIILVFDAHKVKNGVGKVEHVDGIRVVYTREGETADMFIEKLVGKLTEDNTVGVATSDWAEQRIVLGKGAYRISARELRLRIRHAKLSRERYIGPEKGDPFRLDTQLGKQTKSALEKWRRKNGR